MKLGNMYTHSSPFYKHESKQRKKEKNRFTDLVITEQNRRKQDKMRTQ